MGQLPVVKQVLQLGLAHARGLGLLMFFVVAED